LIEFIIYIPLVDKKLWPRLIQFFCAWPATPLMIDNLIVKSLWKKEIKTERYPFIMSLFE
jgi:hypothetical protein